MSVEMSFEYLGELHTALRHGPSGVRLETDAPKDNEGRGESFSPTDLVGAALASCAVTTMAIRGRKEGITFEAARGEVVKEMTTNAPRRIRRLALRLEMPAGLGPEARRRLEDIARSCPVAMSLAGGIDLPMEFVYPD